MALVVWGLGTSKSTENFDLPRLNRIRNWPIHLVNSKFSADILGFIIAKVVGGRSEGFFFIYFISDQIVGPPPNCDVDD